MLPPCPPRALPEAGGRVDLPPLTGPEQHGPVEAGGLAGPPDPLAQPLRHAPVHGSAEPALQAGSAPRSAVPGRSASVTVTLPENQTPPRIRLQWLPEGQAQRRPRGRDRGRDQVGIPAQAADWARVSVWHEDS